MVAPDAACRPRVEPQKADFADASRPPYFITPSTGCSSHFPNRFFCGTVFTLDAVGNFSVLHRFDCFDGARPYPRLVRDGVGNPLRHYRVRWRLPLLLWDAVQSGHDTRV